MNRFLTFLSLSGMAAFGVSTIANAQAQWTAVTLHPNGFAESIASGCSSAGTQGGYVSSITGTRATLWNQTASKRVDLHPSLGLSSEVRGMSATRQVGLVRVAGVTRAAMWSGTQASYVDLHPATATFSQANAAAGNQQVGYARFSGGLDSAQLWTGSAASRVDLHPVGASRSYAMATDGTRQFGYVVFPTSVRAGQWTGSAGSWTSMHPASATDSYIFAADGARQGGAVTQNGVVRATLWNGVNGPVVDLHPVSAGYSQITGVAGAFQSGFVNVGTSTGPQHACIWMGTTNTFIDLHSVLGANFTESEARAIATDGNKVYVTGYAYNASLGETQAMMWTRNIPRMSGNVVLQDWTAPRAGLPVSIELRAFGGSVALQNVNTTLDGAGNFSFAVGVPSGNYDVYLKCSRWLRGLRMFVAIGPLGSSTVNFTLLNGDCDEDNEVTILDYLILSAAYGTTPTSVGWDVRADLDGDGEVSILDYLILSKNYEVAGA